MSTRYLKYGLISILAALAAGNFCVSAQNTHKYSLTFDQFTELKVQDNVNVVYRQSSDEKAHISYTSDPDFADAFIFTLSGESMKIQVTTDDVGKPGMPTLYVSSKNLAKVENYSDFEVKVEKPAQVYDFFVSLIGNGKITISGLDATKVTAKVTAGNGTVEIAGKCAGANYRLVGAGNILCRNLLADHVTARILGGGRIELNAAHFLRVKGLGSTKIYYTGSPRIKHSGGGKLIPMK